MYYVKTVQNGSVYFYRTQGIKWTDSSAKASTFTLDQAQGIVNQVSDKYNALIVPV